MAYEDSDLQSALVKLAEATFTAAETEAVADFLSAALNADDDAAGFAHEPQKSGFLLDVSGLMTPNVGKDWTSKKQPDGFSANDDLAR